MRDAGLLQSMRMPFACDRCGGPRLDIYAGVCPCGSQQWLSTESPFIEGVSVAGLDVGYDDVTGGASLVELPGPLAEALGGGVPLGVRVLLAGLPGAGKSTLAAEFASAFAAARRSAVYWADRDQPLPFIRACFARTGSSGRAVQRVRAADWSSALVAVPDDANALLVVDSLQTWTGHSMPSCLDFLLALRERGERQREILGAAQTVLVICESNADGGAHGWTSLQHAVDAVALVSPAAVDVPTKCRWAPTPRTAARPPIGDAAA